VRSPLPAGRTERMSRLHIFQNWTIAGTRHAPEIPGTGAQYPRRGRYCKPVLAYRERAQNPAVWAAACNVLPRSAQRFLRQRCSRICQCGLRERGSGPPGARP
jgi:hypothetical protein